MARILTAALVVAGGFLAMVAPVSAEDGGQYARGRNNIAPERSEIIF